MFAKLNWIYCSSAKIQFKLYKDWRNVESRSCFNHNSYYFNFLKYNNRNRYTLKAFFKLGKSMEQKSLYILRFLSPDILGDLITPITRRSFGIWRAKDGWQWIGGLKYVKDELYPEGCGSERDFPNGKWILTGSCLLGNEGRLWKASNLDQIVVVLTGQKYTCGIYNAEVVLKRT